MTKSLVGMILRLQLKKMDLETKNMYLQFKIRRYETLQNKTTVKGLE
jgi:hypothetical protein